MNDQAPERATNSPRDDTIAGTGPGIPDDALGPNEELLQPPTDEQVPPPPARSAPLSRGRKEEAKARFARATATY